jgi:type IV pilus assembly protein PilZ
MSDNSTPKQKLFFLHFKNQHELVAAYMPFIRSGGLFIPTTPCYSLGEQIFIMLRLLNEQQRLAVIGTVVWITPEGGQGTSKPGIGVRLEDRENKIRNTLTHYLSEDSKGHVGFTP